MDVTIGQLFGMVFGSLWVQWGLVGAAIASIAADKSDALKALPAKLSAWWTARRVGTVGAKSDASCESRRLTLVGIRHRASELTDPVERADALLKCDEMDKLAAKLYAEAA